MSNSNYLRALPEIDVYNIVENRIFNKLYLKIRKMVRNPESLKFAFKKDFKNFDFFKDGMTFLNFVEYVNTFDHFDKHNVYCVHISCGIKDGGKPYNKFYAQIFAVYNKNIKKFRFLNITNFNDSLEKKAEFIKELYYTKNLDRPTIEFLFNNDFDFMDVLFTSNELLIFSSVFGNKNLNKEIPEKNVFLKSYNNLYKEFGYFNKFDKGQKMVKHDVYICKINPKIFDTDVETYRNMILVNSLREV